MAAVAAPQSASGQASQLSLRLGGKRVSLPGDSLLGRTSIVKYMLASVKIIIILLMVSTYNLPSI